MKLALEDEDVINESLYILIEDLRSRGVPPEKCEQIAADVYRAALNPTATVPLRVWTLGNLEQKLVPTMAAIDKLASFLRDWDGESELDLIWTDDLKMNRYSVTPEDLDLIAGAQCSSKCFALQESQLVARKES
jgi:hypothetical protein